MTLLRYIAFTAIALCALTARGGNEISGSVDKPVIFARCTSAMDTFTGNAVKNDVAKEVPPMSATLVLNGGYMLAFRSARSHTVSFTCDVLANAAGATATFNIS